MAAMAPPQAFRACLTDQVEVAEAQDLEQPVATVALALGTARAAVVADLPTARALPDLEVLARRESSS